MPIDTSIPLSIKPPQIVDPFQLRAQTTAQAQQARMNQLRIQDAEADAAKAKLDQEENTKIHQIASGGLTDDALTQIAAINPAKAKVFLDLKATVRKEHLDDDKERTDFLLRRLPMITSDAGIQKFKADAAQFGFDVSDVPETFDNQWKQDTLKQAAIAKSSGDTLYKLLFGDKPTPKPDYTLGNQRFSGDTNQPIASGQPSPTRQPAVGSFEDYVAKKYGQEPNPEQILQARKDYQQADDRPRVTVSTGVDEASNIKEAVKGMKDGSIPPQLPGRASKDYTAIMAEAHRQGYDLAQAATDWTATQKHIATLNGAQQTRIRQAVDNAAHSLDVIDGLADQWNGGRFPLLNRGALTAAKQGAMGPKAQQIATQLDAQIADVTSELANVYMGGNSPTDHALTLASKNLSADWTRDQLKAATEMARKNLKIRMNSIANAGVAGASAENPYAPAAPAAPPTRGTKVGRFTVEVEP